MFSNEKYFKEQYIHIISEDGGKQQKTQRWLPGEQNLGERMGWSSTHLFLLCVLLIVTNF